MTDTLTFYQKARILREKCKFVSATMRFNESFPIALRTTTVEFAAQLGDEAVSFQFVLKEEVLGMEPVSTKTQSDNYLAVAGRFFGTDDVNELEALAQSLQSVAAPWGESVQRRRELEAAATAATKAWPCWPYAEHYAALAAFT